MIPTDMIPSLCRGCVLVHQSVRDSAETFLEQLNRHIHVTPKSYLDLVTSYMDMLGEKQQELMGNQNRLAVGVEKIQEANQQVVDLQVYRRDLPWLLLLLLLLLIAASSIVRPVSYGLFSCTFLRSLWAAGLVLLQGAGVCRAKNEFLTHFSLLQERL